MSAAHTEASHTPDLVTTPCGDVVDPKQVAQSAGLRYVSDTKPGIKRKRAGKYFSYIGLDGKPIRDPQELKRIRALAIPPAWTHVWICPKPNGHIQATGRDAKGRKQYRYHPRWREVRDETKYHRMIAFGEALPAIRKRVKQELARPGGLSREKVLAAVISLLDVTSIRVGNEEYARANRSYGLTTLRNRHVAISGSNIRFHFRGKGGKEHQVTIRNKRLAHIVKDCQELPGHELFQYVGDDQQPATIESADVNDYLRQISGQDFTAKDFRTWTGTVATVGAFEQLGEPETETQAKKNVNQAIEAAANQLGNTKAICRKCYVHPGIIDTYLAGTLLDALHHYETENNASEKEPEGLHPDEQKVLQFLKDHFAEANSSM
jgi:DNA topoisomerase I